MRLHVRHLCLLGILAVLSPGPGHSEEEGPKPAEAPKPEVVLRIFDVRDMTLSRTDFPGPTLQGTEANLTGNPFQPNAVAPTLSAADLACLMKDRYLANEFTDPSTSIEETGGKLVVMQTKSVHKKMASLLDELRAQVTQQVCVQGLEVALESEKVLDWLGKAGQEVPVAAVEKLFKEGSGARVVSTPQFTTYQGVRAHVLAGRKVSYLADVDVSGGTYDPVIKSYIDGAVLDARPTLDTARRRVSLDLNFFRSAPQGELAKVTFEGILAERTAVTNKKTYKPDEVKEGEKGAEKKGDGEREAGKGGAVVEEAQNNSPPQVVGKVCAKLELPRIAVRSVRTTLEVPVKSWVLVAILDPLPHAAPDSNESKPLLLFVCCDLLRWVPISEKDQG